MITIGIVTFSKRFELFKSLVTDIRKRTDTPILVCVNGNLDGTVEPEYLSNVLQFCASHPNVFPQVFPTFQGLAKLWNTLVINAPTEHVWLLNDDVEYKCDDAIQRIEKHIEETNSGLFYAPWGWSHFVISKTLLDNLNYFDERLIGIGEEDGDFLWRFERHYGYQPTGIEVPGVGNKYDFRTAHDNLDTVYGNKTRFNTNFIYGVKYRPATSVSAMNGQKGMFVHPVTLDLPNLNQYPYETFKRQHAKYLKDASEMPLKFPIDPKDHRDFQPWVS